MNRKKIISKNRRIPLINIVLLIYLFFGINQIIAQSSGFSKNYSEVKNIRDNGGLVIGELEYQLAPGWWQYNQSCDRGKWIPKGQECTRADYKACCDLQKHDYQSVVKPTLSKTTEVIVPANGKLISMVEVQRGKGIDENIMVYISFEGSNGVNTTVINNVLKNNAQIKSPTNHRVKKGDKVFIKIEAKLQGDWGRRYFHPQGAKVQVYLIPDDLSAPIMMWIIKRGTIYDQTDNKELKSGDYIKSDHIYQNGKKETVIISWNKGGELRIAPKSRIKVLGIKKKQTTISLITGRLWSLIFPRTTTYKVETLNTVTTVEGTEFETAYDPATGKTTVTVWDGTVSLKCKNNNAPPTMVNAGMQATMDNNCNQTVSILSSNNNTPAKAGWKIDAAPDFSNAIGKPCAPDKEFVLSLYHSVVEYDLEVSFATGYGGAHMRSLQNGESRLSTILSFFNSPGYLDKQKSGQEFMRDTYQAVLGREPSATEINQWSRIARNDLIKQLFNSNEYRNLMASCPEIGKTSGITSDGSSSSGSIRVVSATYGGNCNGVTKGNVTAHIADKSNGKSIYRYTVDHRVIGDPAPGCAKSYIVQYRCGNNPKVYEIILPEEAGWGDKVIVLDCEGKY